LTKSSIEILSKGQMISIRQIKAARALLGWSQEDLAKFSGVSYPTIARLESTDGPIGGRPDTEIKIVRAIVAGGGGFSFGGVYRRRIMVGDKVRLLAGEESKDSRIKPGRVGLVAAIEAYPDKRDADGLPRVSVKFGSHESKWLRQSAIALEPLDEAEVDYYTDAAVNGDAAVHYRRPGDDGPHRPWEKVARPFPVHDNFSPQAIKKAK
jgi:DNA-binding XRE family transcriptional regulator